MNDRENPSFRKLINFTDEMIEYNRDKQISSKTAEAAGALLVKCRTIYVRHLRDRNSELTEEAVIVGMIKAGDWETAQALRKRMRRGVSIIIRKRLSWSDETDEIAELVEGVCNRVIDAIQRGYIEPLHLWECVAAEARRAVNPNPGAPDENDQLYDRALNSSIEAARKLWAGYSAVRSARQTDQCEPQPA